MLLRRGDTDFPERGGQLLVCNACQECHDLSTYLSIYELRQVSPTEVQEFSTLFCGKCFLRQINIAGEKQ